MYRLSYNDCVQAYSDFNKALAVARLLVKYKVAPSAKVIGPRGRVVSL